MKISRQLAIIDSLRADAAKRLSQDATKEKAGLELQQLTTAKLLLLKDRCVELEKELYLLKLCARFKKTV